MRRAWIWIALAVVVLLYMQGGVETEVKAIIAGSDNEETYGPYADAISGRLGLDPLILRAIITQESSWVPTARNRITNDYGLGQINIKTATTYNTRLGLGYSLPDDLLDPFVNLKFIDLTLTEIVRQGKLTDPTGIFSAWNVGWPKAAKGVRSPYLANYQARYDAYAERTANG